MKTFVVLGMHRSATSLISEGMNCMGVDMGNPERMMAATPPAVNTLTWEDSDFKAINRSILNEAYGSWHSPPPIADIIKSGKKHKDQIKQLISEKSGLWGWKDPRTTLTIECFVPYLTNPHYIACFRDPEEVAKSLQRRNGFSIEKGIKLANIYNYRLLEFLTRRF
jgi:hypothetical protein